MTTPPARALVLVDLQHDFLTRPGLTPDATTLVDRVADLLEAARSAGVPVAHVHTLTNADGTDRMPHWVATDTAACVAGTPGAEPPPLLAPTAGELVASKQFYSGFDDPALDAWLRERAVTDLIVAGVYLHACVRNTAVDAYRQGYRVVIADDGVGTTDLVHATLTRDWLDGRAARFAPVAELVDHLAGRPALTPPEDDAERVAEVTARARTAQLSWAALAPAARADALDRWAAELEHERDRIATLIVEEVAKPVAAAEDEVGRAAAHVRSACALVRERWADARELAPRVRVRYRPLGVVGLVMPWNNPVALAVGKLAPALALGNGAVLKPPPEAPGCADALLDTLRAAGIPDGLVGLVHGARATAEALCDDPGIDGVAVTGSIATGRAIAARCARTPKPVQAELGGNNAAIVLADADLARDVPDLVRAAFGYSGQRCTAIRRFVVERSVVSDFEARARTATEALVVGDPHDRATDLGPMISVAARDRVLTEVGRAIAAGARLVTGGAVPEHLGPGPWITPTIVADAEPESAIVQDESFGPVAVIQVADDLDHAIALANGVRQGLVLAACTSDPGARAAIADHADVGMVQLGAGPLPVHPDAPFGGWKASGIGPPEHGEWDVAFFARTQAVYGDLG